MCKKVLLPAIFLFVAAVASAQNYVTLYEDCNYSGKQHFLEPGNYKLYQMKIKNDQLSCLNIPYGMKVTIYENDDFGGASKTYTSNIACLEAQWNDKASSIVVENTYNQPYNPNDYVVFYNDCYNRGGAVTLRPGRYTGTQLGGLKYNISSFTIYGNLSVKAYINAENLSGYSITHNASESCLGSSENDKIGSLVIEYRSNYNNNNNYNNNSGNVTIYTDCNYRGNSVSLAAGYYQGDKLGLFKYNISSLEIPSTLRVKAYVNNENLGGSYYTLSENNSCLSSNLNNRIGSIIIEEVNNNNNNNYQPNSNDRVIIYTDESYRGQSASLLPGTYATMTQFGFPDNALSSLQLPAGYKVVLYEFENFAGKSYTVNKSKTGFIISGWNDKTSSIAVYRY